MHRCPRRQAIRFRNRLGDTAHLGADRGARLVRDGQPIAALDSARIAAVVNPKEYQDKKRPVRGERLLVFRLDDFTKPGAYSVEIVGSNDRKAVSLVLPQALLDAVRRDAARWRSGR